MHFFLLHLLPQQCHLVLSFWPDYLIYLTSNSNTYFYPYLDRDAQTEMQLLLLFSCFIQNIWIKMSKTLMYLLCHLSHLIMHLLKDNFKTWSSAQAGGTWKCSETSPYKWKSLKDLLYQVSDHSDMETMCFGIAFNMFWLKMDQDEVSPWAELD